MDRTESLFVRLTICEPFPVTGGVPHRSEARGPFYAAGSRWYSPYTVAELAGRVASAEALRERGWTASVAIVSRENGRDVVVRVAHSASSEAR